MSSTLKIVSSVAEVPEIALDSVDERVEILTPNLSAFSLSTLIE